MKSLLATTFVLGGLYWFEPSSKPEESLPSFSNSSSFWVSSNTFPVLDLRPLLLSDEVSGVLCAHTLENFLPLFSVLPLRLTFDLHSPARLKYFNPLWGQENKSLTAWPPRRTLCGGSSLHSMQESPGLSRETIETHSRRFLT
jgi:hypothetical protein